LSGINVVVAAAGAAQRLQWLTNINPMKKARYTDSHADGCFDKLFMQYDSFVIEAIAAFFSSYKVNIIATCLPLSIFYSISVKITSLI
jgi:hypothetical protein